MLSLRKFIPISLASAHIPMYSRGVSIFGEKLMGEFQCVRVWRLKQGATYEDIEALASSGVLEMQRWIPGVKRLGLLRLRGEPKQYLMRLTFVSYEAYMYWRQVEEEAPDYWERYASILMHWEQLCELVAEYIGESVVDTAIDERM